MEYKQNDAPEINQANRLTIVLLVIYLLTLCWILLFKLGVQFSYMENREVNFIPFSGAFGKGGRIDYAEIIMNVVVFIPLGIYAGILFNRRSFGSNVFFFSLVSLFIEALQYILSIGAFDITDIITNTSGGITGLLLFRAIEKVCKNSVKAQRLVNMTAAAGTVIMIILLVLLKMNMLPVRYQ